MLDEESIDELMNEDDDVIIRDSEEEAGIDKPIISIDLNEVNAKSMSMAQLITERLSNYYFDEKYIKEHPYIPTKIMMEMDSIRRLMKMLLVNETAQDALISAIAISAGKGTLYISLTSLQKSILLIEKQLNSRIENTEQIFQKMQAEAERQFAEAEKDENGNADGTLTIRGSREFIKELNKRMYGNQTIVISTKEEEDEVAKKKINDTLEDASDMLEQMKGSKKTSTEVPAGATPISDIIG